MAFQQVSTIFLSYTFRPLLRVMNEVGIISQPNSFKSSRTLLTFTSRIITQPQMISKSIISTEKFQILTIHVPQQYYPKHETSFPWIHWCMYNNYCLYNNQYSVSQGGYCKQADAHFDYSQSNYNSFIFYWFYLIVSLISLFPATVTDVLPSSTKVVPIVFWQTLAASEAWNTSMKLYLPVEVYTGSIITGTQVCVTWSNYRSTSVEMTKDVQAQSHENLWP